MPPKPQPVVRTAQPEDAAEIARLNALFNEVDEPAEQYARRLTDPRRVDTPIIAEIDGHVAGLANLRLVPNVFYTEPYAELTELFVEEGYRRLGIGNLLIAYAEDLASANGAREMIILTDLNNRPAQALFHSRGYVHHDIALSKDL